MITRSKRLYKPHADFTFHSGTNIDGYGTKKATVELPNEHPIDSIKIEFSVTTGTLPAGTGAAYSPHGLMDLIKRIGLKWYPGDGATSEQRVDVSGPGLFEWNLQTLGIPDADTIKVASLADAYSEGAVAGTSKRTTVTATAYKFSLTLPCAHPQLPSPIREFFCLPVHRYTKQSPELYIETAPQTEVSAGDTNKLMLNLLKAKVWVQYRPMSAEMEAAIDKAGGFVNWNLSEYDRSAASAAGNDEFKVPGSGWATGMLLRSFSAATGLKTRGLLSAANSVWQLRYGTRAEDDFELEDIEKTNAESMPHMIDWVSKAEIYRVRPKFSYYFDYLHDGNGVEPSGDFGSLMPIPAGVNTNLYGPFAAGAAASLLVHRSLEPLPVKRFRP